MQKRRARIRSAHSFVVHFQEDNVMFVCVFCHSSYIDKSPNLQTKYKLFAKAPCGFPDQSMLKKSRTLFNSLGEKESSKSLEFILCDPSA